MDNYTEYDGLMAFQRNFVKMALDEYNSPDQNWTDLALRYWTVIDERLGGNCKRVVGEFITQNLQIMGLDEQIIDFQQSVSLNINRET